MLDNAWAYGDNESIEGKNSKENGDVANNNKAELKEKGKIKNAVVSTAL